jgi:hypothetical protein
MKAQTLILVFLLVATAALAKPQKQVVLKVVCGKKPMAGVVVRLNGKGEDFDYGVIGVTNKDGEYFARWLHKGRYKIRVYSPDHLPVVLDDKRIATTPYIVRLKKQRKGMRTAWFGHWQVEKQFKQKRLLRDSVRYELSTRRPANRGWISSTGTGGVTTIDNTVEIAVAQRAGSWLTRPDVMQVRGKKYFWVRRNGKVLKCRVLLVEDTTVFECKIN